MKKKQILILISQPFNEHVVKKIKIEALLDAGFQLEVLDLSKFMMPQYSPINFKFIHRRLKIRVFQSRGELKEFIRKVPCCCAIDLTNQDPKIRSLLNANNVKIIRLLTGGLPVVGPNQSNNQTGKSIWIKRIQKYRRSSGFASLAKKTGKYIFQKIMIIWYRPYVDVIILGAQQLFANEANYVAKHTKLVNSHVEDFDTFHNCKNTKNTKYSEGKFMVFLDQYISGHPDLIYLNVKHHSLKSYYERLRFFFEQLENLGYEIIIASHPRDERTEVRDFGDRKFLKGVTSDLVLNSSGVIMHCSNSLNFAVLANKPILFVADKEILDIFFQIDLLCKWFEKKPLMIDSILTDSDIQDAMIVNESAYQSYKENYIQTSADSFNTIDETLIRELEGLLSKNEKS